MASNHWGFHIIIWMFLKSNGVHGIQTSLIEYVGSLYMLLECYNLYMNHNVLLWNNIFVMKSKWFSLNPWDFVWNPVGVSFDLKYFNGIQRIWMKPKSCYWNPIDFIVILMIFLWNPMDSHCTINICMESLLCLMDPLKFYLNPDKFN